MLLVDDENMIIEAGGQMLERLGYNTITAKNGKEAIKIFMENHEKIDLVILDMIMPDIDGGEVFDILKSNYPDIKVLLCSGYSVEGQATEIMNRGCAGFIQKPFNINLISHEIRKYLDLN